MNDLLLEVFKDDIKQAEIDLSGIPICQLEAILKGQELQGRNWGFKPIAKFLGWQENPNGDPIALYTVYGGSYNHSTLAIGTLVKRGIEIPD